MFKRCVIFVGLFIIVMVMGGLKSKLLAKTNEAWVDKIEIGYNKGIFFKTADQKYSLKIQFLLQPQHEYLEADKVKNTNSFSVKRGQMSFGGNVIDPKVKYRVMYEMPGTIGGATVNLRDAWIDWQWKEYLSIKSGQFLVNFDYENIEPSWALPFVDRSIINTNLGFERDLGVDLHGSVLSNLLNYDFFILNGDGRNRSNLNTTFKMGGRAIINFLGLHDYMVSDIENSQSPHLALGVGMIHDNRDASVNANSITRYTSDLAFRYRGFSLLGLMNLALNSDKNKKDWGALLQTGYFVMDKQLETVLRWARVYKNTALGTDNTDPVEASFGLNYYIEGHSAKIQTDYSFLGDNASTDHRDDHRVRTQLQLFF